MQVVSLSGVYLNYPLELQELNITQLFIILNDTGGLSIIEVCYDLYIFAT